MPPSRYRKKPVVIEAIQLLSETDEEVHRFCGYLYDAETSENAWEYLNGEFEIETLEGMMTAYRGDWIIRGIKGELYPCKPDIFELTYEPAE